ncbi:MAG: DUF222 domain-containing protein [Mycobacteriaceae bacterium]
MITSPPRTPSVVLAALAVAGRAESAAVAAKLALAHEVVGDGDGDGDEEFAACEVAAARSISSTAAKNLAHLGDVLAHRLPRVRATLQRGDLDLVRARAIIDRTQNIDDPFLLARAEGRILDHVLVPGRCVTRGQTEAAADRCVDLRPDLDACPASTARCPPPTAPPWTPPCGSWPRECAGPTRAPWTNPAPTH